MRDRAAPIRRHPWYRCVGGLAVLLIAACSSPTHEAQPAGVAISPDGHHGGPATAPLRRHTTGALETTLLEVRRSGPDTLVVRWRYHNRSSERQAIVDQGSELHDAFEAAFLVDSVSKAKLLVLRDAQDRVVGGVELGPVSLELEPEQSVTLWAKFPAPPPRVRTVTVQVPGAPPFEGVAIDQ